MAELGKINHEGYQNLLAGRLGALRPEVRQGPDFGVDVSITALPGGLAMAATSDPLSLIPSLGLQESAWLSVHLMANDMATTGFAPQYGQFVLNLPDTLSNEDFSTYWGFIDRYCKEIGVAITGGHTGFVPGQNSTFAGGGTLITIAPESEMVCATGAKEGDVILVTKSCALTATAILGMSFPETIKNKLGKEIYESACAQFYQTSSLKDGLIAAGQSEKFPEITAMHDVTEGGVLGAIYEMLTASGKGGRIENDLIPVGEIASQISTLFDLDPRYCVGAGAMVISCNSEKSDELISRLAKANIACAAVGTVKSAESGIMLSEKESVSPLIYQETDPYWAAYFNALKQGWK
ncbi:AIR synthase family protein [Algoriphagus halophytocola]|uniref:AIR synthase family protein n=1 Tax=Algoriphagus halophytocola TaxID=2991499 RepID=A0ABY6MHJ9_9BACT|nr:MULTISPECIES: AIR synthase family protein [unclassified Algoriphagus]UZD21654.1 AIR synthase family protein [Algoriphagus sp. TR-M5]WBL42866.1 AIR synthase family protein [Algoriphagus sp. TR-M9]